MERIVIAKMGVEGGGVTIFGHCVDGTWSFWQEGSSMYLDDNDDEGWRSWTSDPVSELPLAMPKDWCMMYPTEIHSDFVPQLRKEYEHCCGTLNDKRAGQFNHERWKEILAHNDARTSVPKPIANPQTVGNIGLFYVCYRLSRMGWNVMPTTRNAKGIDILIYSQDASQTKTIQVKSLSKSNPVPMGNKLDHLFADFVIVCRNVVQESPECFVLTPSEVRELVHKGEKNGTISFWLQPRGYARDEFRNKWERIGFGLSTSAGVEK